uniref:Uncharacterized protein n=1 Tax=Timema douglasi TaxID=61478 RepID=A0A7R8VIJ8_TIMDO|nr:unnamed protein product [Timema douglasi]
MNGCCLFTRSNLSLRFAEIDAGRHQPSNPIPINRYNVLLTRNDKCYLSGDGTTLNEQGALKPTADGTDNVLVKQGSFSYTSPEGIPISLTYVADELGFRPEGSHLPVAPAVPPINF